MRAGRLFQAVVVLGAELGAGCGGHAVGRAPGPNDRENLPPFVGGGDAAVVGKADAFWPDACEHESQYRCTNYAPLEGCVCDSTAPARDFATQPECEALTEETFQQVLYRMQPASCQDPACPS